MLTESVIDMYVIVFISREMKNGTDGVQMAYVIVCEILKGI